MEIRSINPVKVVVELDSKELLALSNALNETLNGLDVEDFETRTGCQREEMKNLLEKITSLHQRVVE
jgi:hypothetical protein